MATGSATRKAGEETPPGPRLDTQGVSIRTLSGNITLANTDRTVQKLDPGGSARDVTLPTQEPGLRYRIINAADAAENLVVKVASPAATLVTINQNEQAEVWCSDEVSAAGVPTPTWYLVCVQAIALS